MGRVFSSKTTKVQRFWFWLKDVSDLLLALPSYLNPKPLQSTPLTPEEEAEVEEILKNDATIMELESLLEETQEKK